MKQVGVSSLSITGSHTTTEHPVTILVVGGRLMIDGKLTRTVPEPQTGVVCEDEGGNLWVKIPFKKAENE